jgi:hypothetical protein
MTQLDSASGDSRKRPLAGLLWTTGACLVIVAMCGVDRSVTPAQYVLMSSSAMSGLDRLTGIALAEVISYATGEDLTAGPVTTETVTRR